MAHACFHSFGERSSSEPTTTFHSRTSHLVTNLFVTYGSAFANCSTADLSFTSAEIEEMRKESEFRERQEVEIKRTEEQHPAKRFLFCRPRASLQDSATRSNKDEKQSNSIENRAHKEQGALIDERLRMRQVRAAVFRPPLEHIVAVGVMAATQSEGESE